MSITDQLFHRRLPEFQTIDRIEITLVPRWKTSGMSGDEWRQSWSVQGYFKGIPVFNFACGRKIEYPLAMLPGKFLEWGDNGIADEILKAEKDLCDQPSCKNPWTVAGVLKRLTSDNGSYLDPSDSPFRYFRRFCDDHATRGDCSREDCDDNYAELERR